MLCVPVEQVVPVGIRAVPVQRSGGRRRGRLRGRRAAAGDTGRRPPGRRHDAHAGARRGAGGRLPLCREHHRGRRRPGVSARRRGRRAAAAVKAGGTRLASFAGDRVEVTLAAGAAATAAPGAASVGAAEPTAGRAFAATAACGVCGKESIDDLERLNQGLPVVTPDGAAPVPVEQLEALPDRLRAAQALFDATGGIHAAGIFTPDGEQLCVREDVGRHNAVDKVIGHFVLRDAVPLSDRILVVSGRAGFELVQKALRAAIPNDGLRGGRVEPGGGDGHRGRHDALFVRRTRPRQPARAVAACAKSPAAFDRPCTPPDRSRCDAGFHHGLPARDPRVYVLENWMSSVQFSCYAGA